MSVIVNLSTNNDGEIKRFLDSFFEKDTNIEQDVTGWINVFNKPLEAIDLMTSLIENSDSFNIQLSMSMDAGVTIHVTPNNLNEVIRFMLLRYSIS